MNTTQPDLFSEDIFGTIDREPPSVAGSATSVAAAKEIGPQSGRLRWLVLEFIRKRGGLGATDEEVQAGLDMPPNTERPRRIELVESGHVRDSGKTRKTRSGRKAVVWCATEGKE